MAVAVSAASTGSTASVSFTSSIIKSLSIVPSDIPSVAKRWPRFSSLLSLPDTSHSPLRGPLAVVLFSPPASPFVTYYWSASTAGIPAKATAFLYPSPSLFLFPILPALYTRLHLPWDGDIVVGWQAAARFSPAPLLPIEVGGADHPSMSTRAVTSFWRTFTPPCLWPMCVPLNHSRFLPPGQLFYTTWEWVLACGQTGNTTEAVRGNGNCFYYYYSKTTPYYTAGITESFFLTSMSSHHCRLLPINVFSNSLSLTPNHSQFGVHPFLGFFPSLAPITYLHLSVSKKENNKQRKY